MRLCKRAEAVWEELREHKQEYPENKEYEEFLLADLERINKRIRELAQ